MGNTFSITLQSHTGGAFGVQYLAQGHFGMQRILESNRQPSDKLTTHFTFTLYFLLTVELVFNW